MALDSLAFRRRVLRDVSHIDSSASLFGKPLRIPVLMAPVGALQLFEPGGAGSVGAAARHFRQRDNRQLGDAAEAWRRGAEGGCGPENFSALHPRRRRLLRRPLPARG